MSSTKADYMKTMKSLNATMKLTFKSPKIASIYDQEPKCMSMKDTDFFETEILRQFFINMNRVVPFQFAAYPEDREYDNDQKFTPLHYHAVVRSANDNKFLQVARRKYAAVLRSKCVVNFHDFVAPRDPLYIDFLNHALPESYEEYCLKHYRPEVRLITHKDFSIKPAFSKKTSSLSREVASRMRQREITAHAD